MLLHLVDMAVTIQTKQYSVIKKKFKAFM